MRRLDVHRGAAVAVEALDQCLGGTHPEKTLAFSFENLWKTLGLPAIHRQGLQFKRQ